MWAALWVGLARAACPEAAWEVASGGAAAMELAFANIDDAGFAAARRALDDAIPCVRVELSPSDAVVLHRARALGAFVDGDDASSRKSWAAVRALQPDWQPPVSLMPEGHPLRDLWAQTAPGDTPATASPLAEAPRGGWAIDGMRQNGVPSNRAFVLQGIDGAGGVIYTGYLYARADIPQLDVEMVSTSRVEAPVDATDRRRRVRTWGTVGGVALAAGAGAALAVSLDATRDLDETGVSLGEVADLQRKANAYGGLAGGLGVAALGTLVVVWAVPF